MTNLDADTKLDLNKTSYDDLPYANNAFSYASPEHLNTVGKIFGLNPADVETAKVLELGCGLGGNILGYAARYPKSKVVGVDLSKVQIDEGNKLITQLGLTNIDLKAMDIVDIDDSFGKFDYIICHGFLSWVPKEIQDKMFHVAKHNLAPNGIAYVSYNTLPGWNIVGTFKEMLQYHTDTFKDVNDKLEQARAFISFVQDGLSGSESPYYKFLENEAKIISAADNSYLKHEYLDKGNTQFYFVEFMEMASKNGLAYLADTHLSNMYLGNLPEKAVEKLKTINDIVRVEQYMDFVVNRRFRSTLLCHADSTIQRNIQPQALDDMWISMNIVSNTAVDKLDFKNESLTSSFTIRSVAGEVQCNPNGNFICAVLCAFSENNGGFLSIDEIAKYIKAKCPTFSAKDHLNGIKLELVTLLFKGFLSVRSVKPLTVSKISDKPAISKLALLQIQNNLHMVFNQLNDSINVPMVHRIVMLNLDGKNTIAQIIDKVDDILNKSGQQFQIDGKTVTDNEVKVRLIKDMVNNALQFCLAYAFLVG